MSFALGNGGRPRAEMNVTPLIDVLLVLLIIFMIITPMDPHGLYTAVPQEHGKSPERDTPIILQLIQVKNGAPSLAINHQRVIWAELQKRLFEIYKSRPDGVLFIQGDAEPNFEYVEKQSIRLTVQT